MNLIFWNQKKGIIDIPEINRNIEIYFFFKYPFPNPA